MGARPGCGRLPNSPWGYGCCAAAPNVHDTIVTTTQSPRIANNPSQILVTICRLRKIEKMGPMGIFYSASFLLQVFFFGNENVPHPMMPSIDGIRAIERIHYFSDVKW
jgi:hypothetical protein